MCREAESMYEMSMVPTPTVPRAIEDFDKHDLGPSETRRR